MTTQYPSAHAELASVEFALPDVAQSAQSALQEALAFSAAKLRLSGDNDALQALRRNDPSVRGYFEYALAKQVGEHLGALDEEVQAVYLYDDEATAEDAILGSAPSTLVHLLVVVRRKTNALSAMIAALDRALVQAYGKLMNNVQIAHLLDVQVVDEAEVDARTGYAALLSLLHRRPLSVWQR